MASILVVSELFWPEGGGAELATYLILDILAKHNFGITVVTGTKNPAKIRGARYCIAPYLRGSNRIVKWVKMEMLGLDKSFKEMLNNHDILYIPLAAYPLIPLVKRNGIKVVVHLHNYAPGGHSSSLTRKIFRLYSAIIGKLSYKLVDAMVCGSLFELKSFINFTGINETQKINLIPHGVSYVKVEPNPVAIASTILGRSMPENIPTK
jgi:glycosyltransferase involved in cell wall biosynthesis